MSEANLTKAFAKGAGAFYEGLGVNDTTYIRIPQVYAFKAGWLEAQQKWPVGKETPQAYRSRFCEMYPPETCFPEHWTQHFIESYPRKRGEIRKIPEIRDIRIRSREYIQDKAAAERAARKAAAWSFLSPLFFELPPTAKVRYLNHCSESWVSLDRVQFDVDRVRRVRPEPTWRKNTDWIDLADDEVEKAVFDFMEKEWEFAKPCEDEIDESFVLREWLRHDAQRREWYYFRGHELDIAKSGLFKADVDRLFWLCFAILQHSQNYPMCHRRFSEHGIWMVGGNPMGFIKREHFADVYFKGEDPSLHYIKLFDLMRDGERLYDAVCRSSAVYDEWLRTWPRDGSRDFMEKEAA